MPAPKESVENNIVTSPEGTPIAAIIMGSQSDWPTMRHTTLVLAELDLKIGLDCAKI